MKSFFQISMDNTGIQLKDKHNALHQYVKLQFIENEGLFAAIFHDDKINKKKDEHMF